jgi:GNAT superfamily N-acetyltransferase
VADFTIDEVSIPQKLEDAGTEDYIATNDVRNAIEAHSFGNDEHSMAAEETLPWFLDQENEPTKLFAARVDGQVVARADYRTKIAEDATIVWVEVGVLPEFRGRGIGRAIADKLEALALEEKRTHIVTYAFAATGDGEQIPSPTGFGSIPRDARDTKFLLARGYALEQVERVSRISLPIDPTELADRLAAAAAASGTDYTVHYWIDHSPERFLDDMAVLATRMSTDAPQGGLDEPEDVWTAERIVEHEKRYDESPRTVLTAAVEHVPSGRLVGFTDLSVPAEPDRAISQYATIVIREHRGHKLGMLLKVANFDHLRRERPGHPSIITYNAEENRHMLNVNEAVGFVPIAHYGAWKKVLGENVRGV